MTTESAFAPIWMRMLEEERYDIPRCDVCMFPKPAKRIGYIDKPAEDGGTCRMAICDECRRKQ